MHVCIISINRSSVFAGLGLYCAYAFIYLTLLFVHTCTHLCTGKKYFLYVYLYEMHISKYEHAGW